MRRYAGALLVIGLAGRPVAAAPILPVAGTKTGAAATTPEGTYTYAIHHATLGQIGTHVAQFHQTGGDAVAAAKIDLDARVAFARPYWFVSTGHEVWHDGRFVELETATNGVA
jgi:hypothetical protein